MTSFSDCEKFGQGQRDTNHNQFSPNVQVCWKWFQGLFLLLRHFESFSWRHWLLRNKNKNLWKHWDIPIDQGKASLQYQDESLSKKVAMSCLKVNMTSFDHYVIEKSSYYVIFLGFGWIFDGFSTGCKDFIRLRNHKRSTWFKLGKFYRASRISPKQTNSIPSIWPKMTPYDPGILGRIARELSSRYCS